MFISNEYKIISSVQNIKRILIIDIYVYNFYIIIYLPNLLKSAVNGIKLDDGFCDSAPL